MRDLIAVLWHLFLELLGFYGYTLMFPQSSYSVISRISTRPDSRTGANIGARAHTRQVEENGGIATTVRAGESNQRTGSAVSSSRDLDLRAGQVDLRLVWLVQSNLLDADEILSARSRLRYRRIYRIVLVYRRYLSLIFRPVLSFARPVLTLVGPTHLLSGIDSRSCGVEFEPGGSRAIPFGGRTTLRNLSQVVLSRSRVIHLLRRLPVYSGTGRCFHDIGSGDGGVASDVGNGRAAETLLALGIPGPASGGPVFVLRLAVDDYPRECIYERVGISSAMDSGLGN